MLNSYFPTDPLSHARVPRELGSILLVEANPELRLSRRLLLTTLQLPVLAVSSYKEICELPPGSNCCLVAIDLLPSEREAHRIAAHARRTWGAAKILLLGRPSDAFDDPLYDEAFVSNWNPRRILETIRRLLQPSIASWPRFPMG